MFVKEKLIEFEHVNKKGDGPRLDEVEVIMTDKKLLENVNPFQKCITTANSALCGDLHTGYMKHTLCGIRCIFVDGG